MGGTVSKKKILVIDDDRDILTMLRKRLEANGFECTCVTSVELAIHSFSQTKPDLVLLDLMFRGPNGTAFLQLAKKGSLSQKKQNVPIIIVSGCQEKDVVDYVLQVGANGFVQKPIDSESLLTKINECLAAA